MKKAKQLSLFKDPRKNTKLWWIRKQKLYGGSMEYRKVARPFVSNSLNHLVFKARLGGGIWFTRSQKSIGNLLQSSAQRYGVKIKDFAINKDHIHVLAWGKRRENLSSFLRFFSAEMGRKYSKVLSQFGVKKTNSLWVARPFSRIIGWGKKSLENVVDYLKKNKDEVMGFIPYRPRKHRLNTFLAAWTSVPSG